MYMYVHVLYVDAKFDHQMPTFDPMFDNVEL